MKQEQDADSHIRGIQTIMFLLNKWIKIIYILFKKSKRNPRHIQLIMYIFKTKWSVS